MRMSVPRWPMLLLLVRKESQRRRIRRKLKNNRPSRRYQVQYRATCMCDSCKSIQTETRYQIRIFQTV